MSAALTRVGASVLAVAALCSTRVAAQGLPVRAGIGAAAAAARLHRLPGPGTSPLAGVMLGVDGRLSVGPVSLDLQYAEGTLESPPGAKRDLIHGEALLGFRATSWLALNVGPQVRAVITGQTRERWLVWAVRGRTEVPVLPGAVRTYLEGWWGLGGDFTASSRFDNGRGGAAGVLLTVPRRPIWARFSYRIDQISLGGGAQRLIVEEVLAAVGVGVFR